MAQRAVDRRTFLSSAGKAVAAASVAAGFPAIVPASVFGSTAPGNRINVGAIGAGRISRGHDLPASGSTTPRASLPSATWTPGGWRAASGSSTITTAGRRAGPATA